MDNCQLALGFWASIPHLLLLANGSRPGSLSSPTNFLVVVHIPLYQPRRQSNALTHEDCPSVALVSQLRNSTMANFIGPSVCLWVQRINTDTIWRGGLYYPYYFISWQVPEQLMLSQVSIVETFISDLLSEGGL
ncbi:hypothetical protein B0H14DRAFT_3155198 [Mycena olivaceomarginata]|nr:hypothetical protein B0H14DRAFT_3155198 [Mycena olivaceomarginata]